MDEWEYLSISVALKEVGKRQRAWTLLDRSTVVREHSLDFTNIISYYANDISKPRRVPRPPPSRKDRSP